MALAALVGLVRLCRVVRTAKAEGLSRGKVFWQEVRGGPAFLLAYAVALTVARLVLQTAVEQFKQPAADDFEQAVIGLTFGPATILATFGLCGSLIVGLVGRVYCEQSREWWGRLNAWLGVIAVGWLAWFGLATLLA